MNVVRDNCPNPAVRRAFANGELSDVMAERIAAHVAGCRHCAQELETQTVTTQANSSQSMNATFGSSVLDEPDQLQQIEAIISQVIKGADRSVDRNRSRERVSVAPPDSIGRFEILETVGRGSFGSVHMGLHPILKKKVAIKVSHDQYPLEHQKQRFLHEAETAAQLDHPNLVRVLDAGELPDHRCYIVFEYVEGLDLKAFLKSQRLHTRNALEVFQGILAGIQHAHRRGIVHRDLKPSNVMIDWDMRPRITDFGLALVLTGSQPEDKLGGTLNYMSPEQRNSECNRIDARTDIYALGIILAELLSGRPWKMTDGEGHPLGNLEQRLQDTGIPAELRRICLKCCQDRPQDRYQTVEELREEIRLLPVTSECPPASSGKLISLGLRPFQIEDSESYRQWLTGSRFGQEMEKAIRYWSNRIQRFGYEPCFSVGLISGAAGSGKTSLVQAGILPNLADTIKVRFFDCRRDPSWEIEDFLLHHSTEPSESGRKTLVILDQFRVQDFQDFDLLSRCLRRADGAHLQCLLICDEADWQDTLRLFEELEVALDPMDNFYRLPTLDPQSAGQALLRLAIRHHCLPDDRVTSQAIAEQIIERFSGLWNWPTVHLFFQVHQHQTWDQNFLQGLDDIQRWHFNFARDQWFAARSPKLLLPVLATLLDQPHSFDVTRIAQELGDHRVVTKVIPYLENQTVPLLIHRPTKRNDIGDRYQWAHSFLRPIIADYLSESEKSSSLQGRAWYQLNRGAHRWKLTRSDQDLIPLERLPSSALAAAAMPLTRTERKYLRQSLYKAIRSLSVLLVIVTLLTALLLGYRQLENYRLVGAVLNGDYPTRHVPSSWYHRPAVDMLSHFAADRNKPIPSRATALSAISQTPQFRPEVFVDLLINSQRDERQALAELVATTDNSALRQELKRAFQSGNQPLKMAWALLYCQDGQEMVQLVDAARTTDRQMEMARQIRDQFPPAPLLAAATSQLPDTVKVILLDSLEQSELQTLKDEPGCIEAVTTLASQITADTSPRLIAAIDRIAFNLNLDPEKIFPANNPQRWVGYLTAANQLMLPAPNSEQGLMISASLVRWEHIQEFLESESPLPHPLISAEKHYQRKGYPAVCVIPQTAMEYCNYLSLKEGRTPVYQLTEKILVPVEHHVDVLSNRSQYQIDPHANGYRLLTESEWRSIVSLPKAWSENEQDIEETRMAYNYYPFVKEVAAFGRVRPNPYGFFDTLCNCFDLCHQDANWQEYSYCGGMFMGSPVSSLEVRQLEGKNTRGPFVGFRIACPSSIPFITDSQD